MYIFDDYLDFEAIPTDNNNFLGYYDASGNLIYSGSAIDATEVGMYFEPGSMFMLHLMESIVQFKTQMPRKR